MPFQASNMAQITIATSDTNETNRSNQPNGKNHPITVVTIQVYKNLLGVCHTTTFPCPSSQKRWLKLWGRRRGRGCDMSIIIKEGTSVMPMQ